MQPGSTHHVQEEESQIHFPLGHFYPAGLCLLPFSSLKCWLAEVLLQDDSGNTGTSNFVAPQYRVPRFLFIHNPVSL